MIKNCEAWQGAEHSAQSILKLWALSERHSLNHSQACNTLAEKPPNITLKLSSPCQLSHSSMQEVKYVPMNHMWAVFLGESKASPSIYSPT